MLDIKFIRQNPEIVKEGCQKKQVKVDVEKLLEVDKKRREALKKLESLRAEQNRQSYLISKAVDPTKRDERIALVSQMKADIRGYENYLKKITPEYEKLLRQIPNLPLEDVPVGQDERNNVVVREVAASGEPRPPGRGKKPKFNFKPKDHLELGESLKIIDVKRAAKASGSRFGYLKREAVLLEFALVNLALEVTTKEGFIPVVPPVLIKPDAMRGMGYIDTKEDLAERYFLEKDQLFLIGTAEQSIGPLHQGDVFDEKELPKRAVAFSTCFREEAGSYGKDTRGILRVHQFDKVEMFSFSRPEDSKKELKFFLKMAEELMQSLKLPYRIVQVCTGDLARPSAATFDLEAWMPGQNKYRETHSFSNCTDFQARRLNIRYRNSKTKKLEFVYTLNGTAFAVGRTLIAIIENYQRKDGTIAVPKVLQKYTKFTKIPHKK